MGFSVIVFILAILAGMPAGSLAQNLGHSPVFDALGGHSAMGQGTVTVDLPGKSRHAVGALGRHGGPPGLDVAPPRVDGEARLHGFAHGKKLEASGPLAEKGTGVAASAKNGARSKPHVRYLPTCE